MKEALFGQSPVDHHIQLQALRTLFKSKKPISFSDLKPDDIDNSLFVYHLRKLEARGLIDHDETGYWLTADGARRVNFVSTDTLKPDLNPRLLVAFLAFNEDKTQVLISHRLSAVAEYIGPFALPAGKHRYGLALNEAAEERANILFGRHVELKKLGRYETLHTSKDDYVHHVVADLFETTVPMSERLPHEEHYELVWVPVDAILSGNNGTVLQGIMRHYFSHGTFDDVAFTASAE